MDRLELNPRTSWTTRFLSILLSGIMLATPFSAVAQLPTNPDLVHGSVDFNQQGANLFMNQSSNAAVVNFDSFSIGAQNGVYITQPGATSALLSRVVGADPSVIHGLLDATGIVYLVNQNGIYFGGNSRIDAAGLVASTLDISNANFLAGKNIFEGDSTASIVNEGSISAADFIIFLATNIRNAGDISAASVTMAAAEKVTLQNVYGGVLSVDITGMLGEIDNNGVIEITTPDGDITPGAYFTGRELTSYGNINRDGGEDGGYVVFNASENTAIGGIINAGDGGTVDLLGSLSVTVEADAVISAPGGTIVAQAAAGDTLVSGAIDVSSDDGQGGTAHVLGQRVGLLDSATVDASGATGGGAVNVGGNFQGNGDLQNARRTFVGSNVVIDIDAVDSGDGGTAIVWADGSTEFNGTITGRGAGFAEVSGKETLAFNGQVDLLGHNGELGTLLLDPEDILVTAGGNLTLTGDAASDLDAQKWTGLAVGGDVSAGAGNLVSATAITDALATAAVELDAATSITVAVDIVSAADEEDLTFTAGTDITINDDITLSIGGGVTLDAVNNIDIGNNVIIDAGVNNFNGTITLNSSGDTSGDNDISIGTNSVLSANGGDVVITAPDGVLDIDTGAVISATRDIVMEIEGVITVDGALTPGRFLNVTTGEDTSAVAKYPGTRGDDNVAGGFTLGENGSINLSNDLVIGADALPAVNVVAFEIADDADASSNIQLETAAGIAFPDLTFAGTINVNGGVTFDLDGGDATGGDLHDVDVVMTGSINATTGVSILTQADSGFTGSANIVGDDITITVDGAGDVDIGDITAAGFAFLSSATGNITTGSVTANANKVPGDDTSFAIEVDTDGDVTANGAYTADSQPSLNISIDPSNVINNARFTATGNIDIFATDTITVNADMHASSGRIVLLADDTGATLPLSTADDGTGDLVMSVGTTLTAPNGLINVSGENVTLGGITSGTVLTVTNDVSADGDDTITLTGDLRGDGGVTIQAGAAVLDVVLSGDVSITAIDNLVSLDTTSLDGAFALNIDAGDGAAANITLGIIGATTPVESLTVSSSDAAASLTLNGNITVEQDITFTHDTDATLGGDVTITSNDGAVTMQAAVTGTDDNFTVSAESIIVGDIDTVGGDISLTSTSGDITAAALTSSLVTATSGTITVDAANDLTTGAVTASGAAANDDAGVVEITAGDNYNLGGSISATGTGTGAGAKITLDTGRTTIGAGITATLNTTGTVDGVISITGAVDGTAAGTENLTINAADADVTISDTVGGNNALALVDITTGAAQTLSLGGSITATEIDLAAVTAAVVLTGDVTLTSTDTDVDLQNAADIDATTAGVQGLAISTGSGAVGLTVVGDTTALDFLTVTTSGTTTLAGDIATVNAIDMSAATGGITITANRIIDSTAGSIDLSGSNIAPTTVDTETLTVGGATTTGVRLAGIGQTGAVGSVTVNSLNGATLTGNITTDNDVTVTGDTVVAAANITIATGGVAGNDITLATINDDAAAARRILTLNAGAGAVTITEVGGFRPLGTLDINAAATSFGGDITVDNLNADGITGAVTLAADVDITVDDSDINIGATAINGAQALSIDAGTGTVNIPTVAGSTDVDIRGGEISAIGIDTSATGGNIALTSTTGSIEIDGDITTALAAGGGRVTIISADAIDMQAIATTATAGDGGNVTLHAVSSLTVNDNAITALGGTGGAGGAVSVTSDLGSADLDDVSTTGDGAGSGGEIVVTALNGAIVITSANSAGGAGANQAYTATAIELGASAAAVDFDASGTAAAGGNITVSATNIRLDNLNADGITFTTSGATADGDINLSGAVNGLAAGAQDLTLTAGTGTISVDSIGQAIAIGDFEVSTGAGVTNLDGSIAVEGAGNDIDIDRAGIVLHRNVNLSALDGDVSINDLAGGGNSLTITADVNETDSGAVNVDAISDVSDLTATAGQALTTSGAIAGSGDISLTANAESDGDDEDLTVGGSIRGSTVTLTAIGTDADTGIVLNSDIGNTAGSLTLNASTGAGTIDLAAAASTLTALGDIIIDSGQLDLTDAGRTITSTEGNIRFDEAVDGSEDLIVNATQGNVTFGAAVGAGTRLDSLQLNAQSANINSISTDVGDIDFTGTAAVVLDSNVVLDTADAGAAGDVLFGNATIDSDAAATIRNLTISVDTAAAADVAGNVSLGEIGGSVPVGILAVNHDGTTDGTITLAGDITTTGAVGFDDDVTDTAITLADDIVITTSNDAVDLGGDVATADTLGGAFSLAVLAGTGQVDLPVITEITGLTTTSGNINIAQAITVAGRVSMTATSGTVDVNAIVTATGAAADVVISHSGTGDVEIDAAVSADRGIDITSGNAINIGTGGVATSLTAQNDLSLAAADDIQLAAGSLSSAGGHLILRGGTDVGEGVPDGGTFIGAAGTTVSSFLDTSISGTGATGTTLNVSGLISNGSIGISQADPINITDISAVNDISVASAAGVTVDGNVDSSGGEIFLESDSDGFGAENLTLTSGTLTAGTVTLTSNTGVVDIQSDPNNTDGGIIFGSSVGITLGADLTATGPIDASVVTNDITLDDDSIITSNGGDITLGGAIVGTQALGLNAGDGVISLQAVGGGTVPTSVTIAAASQLILNSDIESSGPVTLNVSGLTSTTLTDDVTITGAGVALGAVSGPHGLILDGTDAAVGVDSGSIGSLTVRDASNVTFAAPFSTTGNVTVSDDITNTVAVSVGAVLAAGGDLNLTSAGDVTVSAAVSAVGATTLDSTAGTLDIDANVGGGSIDLAGATNITLDDDVHIHATSGDITVSDSLDLDGGADADATFTSDAGDITFTSAVDAAAADRESIIVNALGGTVDFQAAVGANKALGGITINAMASGFDSTVTTDLGAILVQGTGNTHTIAGNVTTGGGDWIIHDDVIVAGADITVNTANGELRVTGTINDDAANNKLTLASANGQLTLESSVGNVDPLSSLTLTNTAVGGAELNGELRTIDLVDLSDSQKIDLGSDVSLVATDGDGQILLNGGAIDGAFGLTAAAGGNVTIGATGQTTSLQRLRIVGNAGDLNNSGSIDISGAITVVDTAEFVVEATTNPGNDITVTGAVVAADAIFNAVSQDVIFSAAQDNTAGNITVTAGVVIDVNNTIGAAGDITFNSDSDLGADLIAGNDLSLLGGTNTLSAAARTLTATNGDIRVTGDFEGAQDLDITAATGDIYTFDMTAGTDPTGLTATAQRWLIEGDVFVNGAIDGDAVPEIHVTAAAGAVTIDGIGIDFSDSGDNLLHGINTSVTLDANTGALLLDDIDLNNLVITAATSTSLAGDIDVEASLTFPSTGGTVSLAENVKITTTDDNVDFGGVVNSAGNAGLEVQAGTGNVTFDLAVGGAGVELGFLTVSGSDVTHNSTITTDDDGHIHLRALDEYAMGGAITAGENSNITIISEGPGQDLDIDNQITSDDGGEGIITLVSDRDVNIASEVTADGVDSQIIITAERDINVNRQVSALNTGGDVIFTAERDIRGDNLANLEVAAFNFRVEHVRHLGNASLDSPGDPDDNTTVFGVNVTGDAGGLGGLTIKEATGNIALGNTSDLIVNEVNAAGNVYLQADVASDLLIDSIVAGGDVFLVTGTNVNGRAPGTSITGDNLRIEDAQVIQGAGAGAFITDVATLTLVDIKTRATLSNDSDLVILGANEDVDATLDITAQGDLTVDGAINTTAANTATENAIELTSGGDMIFNFSTSATDAAATITLDAGGAIVDTATAANSQINAVNLEIIDAASIGASTADDALDIDVTNLTVAGAGSTAAVSGDSYISEADGLTITSTVTDGGISITSTTGDVTLTSMTTSDDSVSVTATTGTLTVATVAAGTGNVTLEATAAALADDGAATLISGGLVTLTSGVSIGAADAMDTAATQLAAHATGAGAVVITEEDGVELLDIFTANGAITIKTGNSAAGDVIITDVTSANDADTISITVGTGGNAEIGTINAGTGAGDVVLALTAAAGQSVTDGDDNSLITADDVTITATGAIGTAEQAINTTAAEWLAIASTTAGGIWLAETDSVTATSVTTAAGPVVAGAGADIALTSVTATGDDATITAGDSITADGAAGADVTAETVNLIAENTIGAAALVNYIGVNATEAVNATADDSDIFIDGSPAADFLVGLLDAGTGNVTLSSAAIAVTDANHSDKNVVGASLTVDSAAGIGTVADAIETGVGTLTVTANTAGVVNIQNTGALDIAGIDNDGTDATVVNMLGSISTSGPVSSTDNVTLRATDSGTDADNLTIGDTVTSDNEDTITLQAGHDVTINAVVSSATGTVIAEADFDNSNDGTLSDGAGSIDTTNLLATGFDVTLDNADTTLTTLAGSAQGDYTFDTPDSYDVGTVGTVIGVTSEFGDINLDTDGTITVGQVVESLTGSVSVTADGAGATVNVGANVSGDDVTIEAIDAAGNSALNVTAATENAVGATTLNADDGTLDIDFNVTAHESLLLQADTNILLAGNLQADDSITVEDGLEVDASSTITADDGDVSFGSTVSAAAAAAIDLAVNAGDTVTFGGNVADNAGANTDLNDLTVNAATLHTDTNIITVGNDLLLGGTNAVEIDGEASVFTAANDIVFNANGTLDAAAGTETLQLVSTAGDAVLGTIGNAVPLVNLDVDAAGIGIINSNITVAGAIDFAGSANVDLSGDSSITSTADGAVTFGTDVDGPFALQITNQSGAVSLQNVGQNVRLDSLSVTSQDSTIDLNGPVSTTGAIDLDAVKALAIDQAVNSIAGDIDVTGSAVTTAGTITTAGDINIDAFTTDVTIGAVVTSTGSDVEINAEVNVGLGANVIGDNVTAQANTGDVNVTFELDNTRGGYDFTGGDQVVVTENITAADGIRLQGLSGGADALSLEDTITAGTDITLTGGVTQSGALIVASTNGSVTIANDVATGANTLNIDALLGNAALGNITGTSIALDVDASTATLNGGTITTNGAIDFTGTGLTTLAAGTVTVTSGGGNIDFGDVGGVNQLTVDAGAGNLTFDGGDIANLTVTTAAAVNFDEDFNTDGQISVNSTAAITVAAGSNVTAEDALAFIGGSVDIDGSVTGHSIAVTGTTTLAGTINGNDGDVTMNSSVAVDGNSNVSSDNGNVTFLGVVEGPSTLTADAPTGTVTFTTTVGTAVTPLSGLDVNADVLVLNANVTTTGTVDLTGTDTVTLGADLVIDTTAADILFDNNSTINEVAGADARLTLTTLGDIRINDAFINDLLVTSGNNISLSGTIDTDADIGMAGALSVTLTDSVTLISAGNVDTPAVDGAQQLSIVSGGDVTTGALGGTTALESFNATGDNVETGAITTNIDVNVIGTDDAAGAITTSGAVTSNNGAIELTAQGGALSTIVLGGNITADDDASFNGNVTLAAGADTFTAGDAVDFTGNLTGADEDVDINAAELTISGSGVLTVDSLDTIGVGLTELATDVTIIADGVDAINLGPVDGSHTLTLTATNGTGLISVSGGDIAGLSVTNAFNITFTGDLGTTGDIGIAGVRGEVTVNEGVEVAALGALSIAAVDITIDHTPGNAIGASVSGDSVTLNTTTGNTISLHGNINGDDGLVDIQDPLNLTGAGPSIISSDNGNVQLQGAVDGAFALTLAAGELVEIDADINTGSVTINGNAHLGGGRTITVATALDVDGDLSANGTVTLNATDAGSTISLQSVGVNERPTSLDIDTDTGVLQLEGDVHVAGDVLLDGADATTIVGHVTIDTTAGADGTSIDIDAISGTGNLTIAGGDADVDFQDAITALSSLTVVSSDTVQVDSTLNIPGAVGFDASELIDIDGAIGGTTAPASITVDGTTELGADVTADGAITFQDSVELTDGDRTLTSNAGDVSFAGAVTSFAGSSHGLAVSAQSGNIAVQDLGQGADALGAVDLDADTADFNGTDIDSASIDTADVGLTTLNVDVSIDTTGLITLGDLIGVHLLTLTSVGEDVELQDAAIQALTIDGAVNVDFAGNFDTTGNAALTGVTGVTTVQITGSVDAGGTIAMTTAGNIVVSGTVEADADIDLANGAGESIDINAAITGATVDVTSGTVTLSSAVAANVGDVNIIGDITIDGASLVAAENGNILFDGTVDDTVAGTNSLEANAPGGTVDFNSTVGAGTALGGLDVHADDVKLDDSVEVAGNIDVDADTIELADDAGDITTTAGSGGNLDLGTAAIDAENANVPDINLTSAGTLTVGPIGQTTQVESVDIHVNTVTDRITLGGSIDSDNAVDITGTAGVATNIHLGSDVDITAGDANITLGNIADANAHNLGAHGGTGDVQIGTIANGADVDIDGADITLGDSVAASVDIDGTNITINAITATDGISAVASNDGAIVSTGVLSSSGSSIELIAAGAIDVGGDVTNSSGEVVISGNTDADGDDEDVTISANLDAGGDVVVTVQGAAGNINIRADQDNRGSTTLNGPVSLNEDLAAADDITVNGAIVIDGDNVPADPVRLITAGGSLDINGDITVTDGGVVENLTLTGTEEVVVENIGVGSPAGALEISTDQAGLGGNIEAASVDTTGAGMTTLHTGVDIDVTGAAGINLGHINGAESLTLSADAAGDVTLRNTDIASLTVDDADAVNVLGQLVASGDVTIAGTTDGIITVDDTADTLNGSISAGGNVTLGTAALIAVNGTVTAVEALTVSTTANVDIDDNLTGDSVDINGDGGISLAGDVRGTNQDVIFRDALTVDGNSTATSENGDLTFVSTIVGPFALNAFADSGTVNFEDSVGAIALASLVVTANAANIAGNISATAGVSFAGTEQVNLDAANVVITAGGAIFFATDSIVSSDNDGDNAGEFSLTLIAGADITINDAVVDGFDASDAGADTINLFGTISAQDPITLGANTVLLGGDAALHNEDDAGSGDITATGSIDGEHEFTLSSGGTVTLGAIGATEQPTELRIDNSNNTILAADTSVDGNIAILATAAGDADAIDVGGAMTSDNGSINLNAGGAGSGIELNGIVSANDDVTLNGADIVLTAVDAANPDINSNTGNIGLHGNFTAAGLDVDLTADSASLNGDVTVGSLDTTGVGTTTLLAAVAINASTNGVDLGELDGPHTLTITAASAAGAVNLDGVDIQALTVDDAVGVTLNGIVHLPGDLSISGAIDGTVDINADIAADGDVTIGDATTDLVDADANIHGGGDITINATDVGGDISISELVSSDNGSVDINADDAIIFDNNGNVIGSDVPAGTPGVTVDSADITVDADLHNDEGSLDLHATGTLDINQSIETGPEGALDLDGDTALTLARGADLTAGGDITVNDNLLLDNPIGDSTVTSEDGDITLQNVAAAEIRNLTVTAAEGTVTIGSLGSADGDDTNDANNLTITAADVLLDNTANGRIEGNLTITATGDVDNNDNSGGGTELNVDGAATIAGNNVDLDGGLVVTGSVTVTALQDIGIGVRTVAQGNVTSGGDIILTADLDLDGDGGVEMNSADLVSTAGNITITGQGVVVDDVDAIAGSITIDGLSGGIAAQTPGDVVADLAAITLDLDGTGPINVETDASNVNAATDGVAGSIIINNVGAGPIVFAGTTAGEDADITLAHTGAGLLTVNDTKASSGDVAIAGGGAIQVNRIDAEDGGATNGITDDAQTVRVTSTGAGDITIAEGDDDADPTNGRTGGISADFALTVLNADGDIDLNSESIFSAGSVELDSTTGSISDISGGDRVNIRALGSATLIGDDEVGNLTDILEVTVGELLVSANSGDADSGFATGLGGLADGSIGPRYVNFIGDAPGLLVWNGDVIGGPPAELQLWLRAGNFDSQGVMLDNTSQVFRNPFFYHKAVMLSDYRAPTTVLEYISASGGKIFGLPRHLALSNNIDILQYTDDPYSWDLEIRRRRDKSRRD